jgi:hypothetical protein
MKRQITRKEFLASTIAASAGVFAGSVVTASAQQGRAGMVDQAAAAPPPWPWPYVALDVEEGRKRGHQYYYDGGCAYGAFHALVMLLREAVGEPYTSVPTQMMYYGGGGAAGWGTLCGSVNGAAAAISLVVDRATATSIVNELFGWYTTAPFPTDVSNDYAIRRAFYVNRHDKALLQTVAGSVLCHASVTTWCTAAGVKSSAPERAERCARVTGDCVARTIQLLNAYFAAQFKPSFVAPASVAACMGCHGTAIGNVLSSTKQDCGQCHKPHWDHRY